MSRDRGGRFREHTGGFQKYPPPKNSTVFRIKVVFLLVTKKTLPEVRDINKEIKRLTGIIEELDENKKALAIGPIRDLAFMRVTMEKLKDNVNREDIIVEMDQGGYSIEVINRSLKQYNDMIPKYNSTKQLLINLFPKEVVSLIDDGFESYVNSRD